MNTYLLGCDVLGSFDTEIVGDTYTGTTHHFENTTTYEIGDVVLYFGRYWKALRRVTPPLFPSLMSGDVPGDSDAWMAISATSVGEAKMMREIMGAISDTTTDYEYGEKQVLELVQYFNALNRPKEFEAAVEGVYAAYENAKVWWHDKALEWKASTAMKQAGADASRLMGEIQAAHAKQAATVPSGGGSAVYKPSVDQPGKSWWDSFTVPTWVWVVGIGAAGLLTLSIATPVIVSVIGARSARRFAR